MSSTSHFCRLFQFADTEQEVLLFLRYKNSRTFSKLVCKPVVHLNILLRKFRNSIQMTMP